MSIESVESNIRSVNMQINQYNDQIAGLRKEIGRLELLESEYEAMKREFEQRNQDGLRALEKVGRIENPLRMINSYTDEMKKIMTGSSYQQAVENFDEERRIIKNKIVELESEIYAKQAAIGRCEEQIAGYHAELLRIRAEEG